MDAGPDTCDVACASNASGFLPDGRRNPHPYVRLAGAAGVAHRPDEHCGDFATTIPSRYAH